MSTKEKMSQMMEHFRKRLKAARIKAKLNQTDAGQRASITQALWCEYERGVKLPGLHMSARLAYAVGKPLAVLLREGKPKNG